MKLPADAPPATGGIRFAEAWHAEVMALAHSLVASGQVSSAQWAEALGAVLAAAPRDTSAPDTDEGYYLAALEALEHVVPVSSEALAARKVAWERAYRATPHGQPVMLDAAGAHGQCD